MKTWYAKLPVSRKIRICFLIVLILALASSAAGIIELIKQSSWQTLIIMLTSLAITVVVALLLSSAVSISISKPIQLFSQFAKLLAVGDVRFETVNAGEKEDKFKLRKDEIGVLANAFADMIEGTMEQVDKAKSVSDGDFTTVITPRSEYDVLNIALTELVSKISRLINSIMSSAYEVDSGAKLVADSSNALSQGASEQAGSIEELTASLEEVTVQTGKNAQNAKKANELTQRIRTDAEASNAQMMEMLRAMDEINVSSDNIKNIIQTIEGIAFQTNILALNAAVEAARAGQHGKGFAVVAEEVRSLAAKSSNAASETTNLIENSIKKIEAGTAIANETAESLSKIVSGINTATELIDEIAAASMGQAEALEQINQTITHVSQVVQNNAAVAQECASASEELSSQAEGLKSSISVFRINKDRIYA